MQAITFYSYKGGVGRTLFVANVARFLAKLRQKVFVIDFDLEAPGLHYKFNLGKSKFDKQIEKGVLDYIHYFTTGQGIPEKLQDYVIQVSGSDEKSGPIYLMPAGNAPSIEYWYKLAQISWHDLFYSEGAKGIPFFLELKEQINKHYKPDFLLIDSRTGITEVGGVATSILSDKVVCLLIMNQENLEGAKAVLQSIRRTPRLHGQTPVDLLPVLTRIPVADNSLRDEELSNSVREFLNEEAQNLSDTLNLPHVYILHSEPDLQVSESLRIGSGKSLHESPLLRDYVRLLAQLISKESIGPHLGVLLQEALEKATLDPAGARISLESLTTYCPHPATYRALLRFYMSRNIDAKELLETAVQFWEVTGMNTDSLLQELVRDKFNKQHFPYYISPLRLLEFGEAVWQADSEKSVATGLFLAHEYKAQGYRERSLKILHALMDMHEANEAVIIEYLELLNELKQWDSAFEIIGKNKQAFAGNRKFLTTWADLIIDKRDALEAEKFLSSEEVHQDYFNSVTPLTAVKLLLLVDEKKDISKLLQRAFNDAAKNGLSSDLVKVGEVFEKLGRRSDFEELIRKQFSPEEAEVFIYRTFHRWKFGMPTL